MKKTIKLLALLLSIGCVLSFAVACNKEDQNDNSTNNNNDNVVEETYGDYSVKIIDGLGNPISNAIVKFTYSDGTVKTRVTEADGMAQLKNVPIDTYKVTIEQGYSDIVIETSEYTLDKNDNSINVVVRDAKNSMEIYGGFEDVTYACIASVGTYTIPGEKDHMTYIVFNAQTTGVYKFSISSNDSEANIGYYGIPMFVQDTHRGEGEYDGKSFEIIIQDAATPYVIGVKTTSGMNVDLTMEKVSEAPFDPYYAPWTDVLPKGEIADFTIPAGSVLTDFDISNPTLSVTLGEDGYYYTSDGKLVYLRISSLSNAQYLDVSLAFIAGLIDQNFGQNIGGYVYDENGNFVGKYTYNTMIEKYYEKCDANGVYPLTAELAEAIKLHGESSGWWNANSGNYLFSEVILNKDNAWLFLCCTAN